MAELLWQSWKLVSVLDERAQSFGELKKRGHKRWWRIRKKVCDRCKQVAHNCVIDVVGDAKVRMGRPHIEAAVQLRPTKEFREAEPLQMAHAPHRDKAKVGHYASIRNEPNVKLVAQLANDDPRFYSRQDAQKLCQTSTRVQLIPNSTIDWAQLVPATVVNILP